MKETTKQILTELMERYPALETAKADILSAYEALLSCFESQNRVYLCGNGGSAADCEHMAGELLKSFKKARPLPQEFKDKLTSLGDEGKLLAEHLESGLPVVSLCGHPAFATAFQNDNHPELLFAQQVHIWGNPKDVLVTFSTSGNSKNCIYAALTAKAKGMKVLCLTGGSGGMLKELCDITILAPAKETYLVQEYHLPIYHCLCAMLEEEVYH